MTRLTEDDPITSQKFQGHKHFIHRYLGVETNNEKGEVTTSEVECSCGITGLLRQDGTTWNNECIYGYENCNAEDGYCEQCQKEHNY